MTTQDEHAERIQRTLRLLHHGKTITETAELLGVTTRTVGRDKAALRRLGHTLPERVRELPDHGTPGRYKLGCRCQGCSEDNTLRCAVAARRRRARGCPDELHGTETGYVNWACRCDECKKAGAAFNKKLVESRKQRILAGDPTVIHGSRGAYNAGCRCDKCKNNESTYRRNAK